MSLVLVTAPMANIHKNPHRDFDMATIREDTVLSIMESINDTDFWQNYPLRVKANTLADGTIITAQAQLDALVEAGHDWTQEQFELPHGHHRHEALARLEWTEVSLLLKYITDETMLLMMANENKEGYGGNTGVLCETVCKVTAEINRSLANAEDFAAYKKEGNELFINKKSFDAAKKDGVGFRKVREFLGKTWSESDVRGAFKILKLIDKGYFTQEDVGTVSSMGLLETVGAMGEFMYEGKKDIPAPDMPMYWKREILNDVVDRCSIDNKGWQKVTVAQLRRARKIFEAEGVNPAGFLKNGNAKTAFDFVAATKGLIFDPDKAEEYNMAQVDDLANKDGFSDYADINVLIEKVKKSIKASFARLASGGSVDDPEESDEKLESATEEDLQAALDGAEAGEGDVIVEDLFGAGTEGGADVVPMPVGKLVEVYTQTAARMGHGTGLILASIDDIKEDATLDMAISALLAATIKLGMARLGRESIVTIFNSEAK